MAKRKPGERQHTNKKGVEERRRTVARLLVKSVPQYEIARICGVSSTQISRDIKHIRKEWKESRLEDTDEYVSQELAKIAVIEEEAWKAWEKSCEKVVSTRVVKEAPSKQYPDGKMSKQVQEQERHGDKAMLDIVLNCIEKRCKLLGIEKPIKIAETDAEGNDLSPEDRREQLRLSLLEMAGRNLNN